MMKAAILLIFVMGILATLHHQAPAQSQCPHGFMTQEWTRCNNEMVTRCSQYSLWSEQRKACEAGIIRKHAQTQRMEKIRAVSASGWQCPATHPIKGNFTTYSGERCIFHVPVGQFYDKTKPEKCYASPADAVADGCRASKR